MTPGKWRKSSRSGASNPNCVETRLNVAGPELRDSKAPELGTLPISRSDFSALLDSLR